METIPEAVEAFLKCRINACTESETYFQAFDKVKYVKELVKEHLLGEIIPYYKVYGYNTSLILYDFLLEPMKHPNSRSHSQARNVEFSLILSSKALVAGYLDQKSHFRKEGIRKKLEAIISGLDFIHVDERIGKLYIGISVTNSNFFTEER